MSYCEDGEEIYLAGAVEVLGCDEEEVDAVGQRQWPCGRGQEASVSVIFASTLKLTLTQG